MRQAVVGVAKRLDPSNHGSLTEAVACPTSVWVVCKYILGKYILASSRATERTFDIKCTWEGLAVASPPSTMSHEVLSLVRSRCARVGDRKVICAANERAAVRAVVLLGKVGVYVVCDLGQYQYERKP